MKHWHEVLPNSKFGFVEGFNQGYAVRHAPKEFKTTLEIGAGLGEHLLFEKLTDEQERNYYTLELRENMSAKIRERFPKINAITGDCQARLDFEPGFFDHVAKMGDRLRQAFEQLVPTTITCSRKSGARV